MQTEPIVMISYKLVRHKLVQHIPNYRLQTDVSLGKLFPIITAQDTR